jgi:hypothetical protein
MKIWSFSISLRFFQALELELVVEGIVFEGVDGTVEIAVFEVQLADAALYLFGVLHREGRHGWHPPRFSKTILPPDPFG